MAWASNLDTFTHSCDGQDFIISPKPRIKSKPGIEFKPMRIRLNVHFEQGDQIGLFSNGFVNKFSGKNGLNICEIFWATLKIFLS